MVLRVAVTMVTEDGLPRGITWAGGDDLAAARSEEGGRLHLGEALPLPFLVF